MLKRALAFFLLSPAFLFAQAPAQIYQQVTVITPEMVQSMCHNGQNQYLPVVDAPGIGNVIVVNSVSVNLQYAGIPYGPPPLSPAQPMSLLFYGADAVISSTMFTVADFQSPFSVLRVSVPTPRYTNLTGSFNDRNKALYAYSGGGCFINGNSPIVVTITYQIVPAA